MFETKNLNLNSHPKVAAVFLLTLKFFIFLKVPLLWNLKNLILLSKFKFKWVLKQKIYIYFLENKNHLFVFTV